jgi:hypothetical protein
MKANYWKSAGIGVSLAIVAIAANAQVGIPGPVGGNVVQAVAANPEYGNGVWIVTQARLVAFCYTTSESGTTPQQKGAKPGKIVCSEYRGWEADNDPLGIRRNLDKSKK